MRDVELSVIVPFCNEAPAVQFTAQGLVGELDGFCEYEILLIDNMSDDWMDCTVKNERMPLMNGNPRTFPVRQRAFFFGPKGSKREGQTINTMFFRKGIMRYFRHDTKQGHWGAKNVGIKNARGKFLFFVDAHTLMSPGSLRKMVAFLRDPPEEKIGGVHAYINYILDSRSLEYKPQKDKFFGYQFCTHQSEEYFVNSTGEVDVSDEIRFTTRALDQNQDVNTVHPLVKPHVHDGKVVIHPSWPKRKLRFPTKPYKVCVMSTCGMMCPRTVIDELGPWHPEFGIYCGGEGYMNFKQSTCGYHHWIHPEAICWHWAEKRGYIWNHRDYVRNEQIAAYVCGGERALQFCVEGRGGNDALKELAQDVRTVCREEREMIASKQVEDLEAYFDRWVANPGVWK